MIDYTIIGIRQYKYMHYALNNTQVNAGNTQTGPLCDGSEANGSEASPPAWPDRSIPGHEAADQGDRGGKGRGLPAGLLPVFPVSSL